MIEEHLGCNVFMGTRARRVGTSGHSTRGWCRQILASSCSCIRIQRSLKVTWRAKACFGLAGRNQRSGHAVRGWFEVLSSKGRPSLRRRCLLGCTERASRVGPGLEDVACHGTPHITLSPRIEDGIVAWRTPHGWRNVIRQRCGPLVKGFQNTTSSTVLSRPRGQAELQQEHTTHWHEYNPS